MACACVVWPLRYVSSPFPTFLALKHIELSYFEADAAVVCIDRYALSVVVTCPWPMLRLLRDKYWTVSVGFRKLAKLSELGFFALTVIRTAHSIFEQNLQIQSMKTADNCQILWLLGSQVTKKKIQRSWIAVAKLLDANLLILKRNTVAVDGDQQIVAFQTA